MVPARAADERRRVDAGALDEAARHEGQAVFLVLLPVPVGREPGEAAEARLAVAQLALGLGASHEVPDLQADRDAGLQQPFVGLLRIAMEELERAQHLLAEAYRKRERGAQARLG